MGQPDWNFGPRYKKCTLVHRENWFYGKIYSSNLFHGKITDERTKRLLSDLELNLFLVRICTENSFILSTMHWKCGGLINYGITYEIRVKSLIFTVVIRKNNPLVHSYF